MLTTLNECTAFGLGGSTMTIMVDTETASRAHRPHSKPPERGIGNERRLHRCCRDTLVRLSPLGLIRHDPVNDQYEHLGAEQAVAFDTTIAGRSLLGAWKATWVRGGS